MTTDAAARRDRAVRRFALVAIAIPLALTVVALVVQAVLLHRLPNPVATHWGADGRPDGFAAPVTTIVMTAVVALGIPLAVAAFALPGLRRGDRGPSYRLLGALAAGTAALVTVLSTWIQSMQVDLADAHDAPRIWGPLIGGFVAAAVVGVAAWAVQPASRAHNPTSSAVTPTTLGPHERITWMREAHASRAVVAVLVAASIALAAAALVAWLTGPARGAAISLTIATVAVGAAVATTTAFRVRIDGRGLSVRGVAGIPRFTIPLDDITSVRTTSVNPLGEFGGWGVRFAPGRAGVVLRAGDALEVERASGRRFVVTVDDAAEGGSALQALVERARGSRHS